MNVVHLAEHRGRRDVVDERPRGRHLIENMDRFVTVRELLARGHMPAPTCTDTVPLGRCPVAVDDTAATVWDGHLTYARWRTSRFPDGCTEWSWAA